MYFPSRQPLEHELEHELMTRSEIGRPAIDCLDINLKANDTNGTIPPF